MGEEQIGGGLVVMAFSGEGSDEEDEGKAASEDDDGIEGVILRLIDAGLTKFAKKMGETVESGTKDKPVTVNLALL